MEIGVHLDRAELKPGTACPTMRGRRRGRRGSAAQGHHAGEELIEDAADPFVGHFPLVLLAITLDELLRNLLDRQPGFVAQEQQFIDDVHAGKVSYYVEAGRGPHSPGVHGGVIRGTPHTASHTREIADWAGIPPAKLAPTTGMVGSAGARVPTIRPSRSGVLPWLKMMTASAPAVTQYFTVANDEDVRDELFITFVLFGITPVQVHQM